MTDETFSDMRWRKKQTEANRIVLSALTDVEDIDQRPDVETSGLFLFGTLPGLKSCVSEQLRDDVVCQ